MVCTDLSKNTELANSSHEKIDQKLSVPCAALLQLPLETHQDPQASGHSLKYILASPVKSAPTPTMARRDRLGPTETQTVTKDYFVWDSKARPGRKSSEELHETVFMLAKANRTIMGSSHWRPHPSHELSPPTAVGPTHQVTWVPGTRRHEQRILFLCFFAP